jgi:hypothetical protein
MYFYNLIILLFLNSWLNLYMLGNAYYNWDSRLPCSGAEVRASVHLGIRVENMKKQGFHDWTRYAARYFRTTTTIPKAHINLVCYLCLCYSASISGHVH